MFRWFLFDLGFAPRPEQENTVCPLRLEATWRPELLAQNPGGCEGSGVDLGHFVHFTGDSN